MLDYLVVGLGIAGVSICEELEKKKKSYRVINDVSQVATLVAGGLYNPVILKRFTLAWKAEEQLKIAIPFYKSLEQKLNVQLDYKLPIFRRFASIEEQNLWFEASDKAGLSAFLSPKLLKNHNPYINAPYGYGQVLHTGRIDTALLLKSYESRLVSENKLLSETFDYNLLNIHREYITYQGLTVKKIIFSEGFSMKKNPFFKYLPLTSTKGEYLTVKAPELRESNAIKSSIFLIPWEKDVYRVGATYKWKDISNQPTEASKTELLQKLDSILKCDYEVIDQVAGIRPTVVDRRPLVGEHPVYKNVFALNGLGSRGVLIAPFASIQLINYIEQNGDIDVEMNIHRFTEKYFKGLHP